MVVVDTKKWLDRSPLEPIKLTENLLPYFNSVRAEKLYRYLERCGLQLGNRQAERTVKQLMNIDIWGTVKKIEKDYRHRWKGPDVPIIILPHRKPATFLISHDKSGLAYPDKLLLFLSGEVGYDHLEALFIHEYHHVCRLNKLKRSIDGFSLADTMILEGLAEYIVQKLKGEQYLAPWTKQYKPELVERAWTKLYKGKTDISNSEEAYSHMLYGKGMYPFMMGYCIGFQMVERYCAGRKVSLEQTFTLDPQEIIAFYEGSLD
ncbi:MAG: DUF2268 domain-containing protein [Bacillus sp. (in: firmicutes)]